MRWIVFIIFAYVLMALEAGLSSAWRIGLSTPHLLLILLVFLGLYAAPMPLAWAALLLGALVDLSPPFWPVATGVWDVAILGPSILAYLAGAYACLQLRTIVFRDSPITLAAVVFVVGIFVQLVTVGVLTLRALPLPGIVWFMGSPIPNFQPADELMRRFFDLVYTALMAIPLGMLLLRSVPLWGFNTSHIPGLHPPRRN